MSSAALAQEPAEPPPATLEGVIVDRSGKPVSGATITAETAKAGSDAKGHFMLSLVPPAAGEAAVVTVLKPGFDPVVFEERLAPGETRTVRYQIGRAGLSAVITGSRQLPRLPSVEREPVVSHFDVTRSELEHTPGAMEDVNRAIANLPGVVADPDLLATLFVRGGAPEELGVYLDDVPLDNPLHLGGFATVFNPMLIESADIWAGVTPARFEPSLSGAMEVHYPTGTAERLHFQADLSIQTAKARVDVPTGVEGLTVVVAARRSFFELYFAGLHAFGLIGSNYVAPELSEYFARVIFKRGRHLFTATYLLAMDGFQLIDQPGAPALFGFDGGVSLSHVLHVTSLRDRVDLGDLRELTFTLAATHDSDATSVTGSTPFARDESRLEFLGGASLSLPFDPNNRLRLGAQLRRQRYDLHGQAADDRGLAPFIALPIIDTGEPEVAVSPRILRTLVSGYAEYSWRPLTPLAFELGGRLTDSAGQAVYSTRVATSVELPVKTVLKAEAGIATQQANDPLLLDASYGNPRLLPERSRQLVVGLEQPLPFRALLRVEAYSKWLDRLVVNPDTDDGARALQAAGQPVFQNLGTGYARGIDFLLVGRTPRLFYGLSGSLLRAERTNPLASGPTTYAAPWDQRLTLSANLSATMGEGWLLSGRATFHTGRPTTNVLGFTRDEANQKFLPIFGPTNGARFPDYFEMSMRVEKPFHLGSLQLAWYAELLNVTNTQNVFIYTYGKGDFANNVEPDRGTFNHLPIRPFFGVRCEN